MAKKIFSTLLFMMGMPILSEAAPCSSISRFGVTWTFQQTECGQFVNGDWWVVGPLTLTGISPQTAVINGNWAHGSMINPIGGYEVVQGFDSRPLQYVTYDATLNVALNVSPSTPRIVPVNSTLISAISLMPGDPVTSGAWAILRTAVPLTVLPTVPPADAFRPPWAGTDKTIRWRENQLDYSKLKNLAPLPGAPSLASLEPWFQRIWLNFTTNWTSRYFHPTENMKEYYQYFTQDMGDAVLALNTNYTNAQKRNLLIGLVQLGIDRYGAVKTINFDEYPLGHNNGKKFPILFAGFMLNDSLLQDIGLNYPTIYNGPGAGGNLDRFSEDGQLFYVEETAPGVYNWNRGGYTSAHRGMPEWGNFHTGNNADDINWNSQGGYRVCCSASGWIGTDLSMKIMGMRKIWNHPSFFDYNDRFIEVQPNGGQASAFSMNMWNTYRDNFGCTWTRDNPANINSIGHFDCAGQNVRCANSDSTIGTLVTQCSQYPSQRAIDYDPCNLGCSGDTPQDPVFSYSVSKTPNSASLQQGQSMQVTVNVNHVLGTPAAVQFNVTNLPTGISASFSQSQCTPALGTPCSSVLTLAAAANATLVSNFPVTIVGAVQNLSESTIFNLSVTPGVQNPTNTAPSVNAGPDQTFPWPQSQTNLAGAISDDGRPNPPGQTTSLWSVVGGPGSVLFENPASPATSATFSQWGVYALRLTANDSALTRSDDVQVTIHPSNNSGGGSGRAPEVTESKLVTCSDPSQSRERNNVPICFDLKTASLIKIRIYNRTGELVRELVNGPREVGQHRLEWNLLSDSGSTVSSGSYTVVFEGDGVKQKRKLAVIK